MSGKIYVCSDLHFGHPNMAIKKRGFSSAEEHDNHIIENWNKIINKDDSVWILGDITMEKSQYYPLLSKLKGTKKVTLGNHDLPQHVPDLLKYVNKVCASYHIKNCLMTHIPIHESELNRFVINIHGHTHDKCIDNPKYVNVSMENINYVPVLLSSIIESIK